MLISMPSAESKELKSTESKAKSAAKRFDRAASRWLEMAVLGPVTMSTLW
jgi:hypothetical protein